MSGTDETEKFTGGFALAAVQFIFTLGWTVYAVMLPGLLAVAGVEARWLPIILMVDQVIFAAMDIAFGVAADRMIEVYRRLARLLLVLTSVSAIAFLSLPLVAGVSPVFFLIVLVVWVISASAVRAPTLVLLAKRAKLAQQQSLVIWYSAGMALAMALSPFVGLALKAQAPQLPFVISAITLVLAVLVLLRVIKTKPPVSEAVVPQPASFMAYLPLLLVLTVAGFGFQVHAFVNAAPLYLAYTGKENLPWLMPLLWVGFFAALLGVGPLVKRFGPMRVAAAGLLLVALASQLSGAAGSLPLLISLQIVCGIGWAMGFAGLMEQASAAGTRGAEGVFMGSFFAVTAVCAFARIAFVTHWLADLKSIQFVLPAALLLVAGVIATVDARKWAKIKM